MKEGSKGGNEVIKTVCQYCGEEFNSRNLLFRHLRSKEPCYLKDDDGRKVVGHIRDHSKSLEKHKIAIQFGYHASGTEYKKVKINEVAAAIVSKCFFQAVMDLYPSCPIDIDKDDSEWTLASAAHLRHPSLEQEKDCSAYLDVLGINYKGGPDYGNLSNNDKYHNESNENSKILQKMQDTISTFSLPTNRHNDNNNADDKLLSGLLIKILRVETVPVSTKFHAEKSCSQRTYQYLLPIKWLDDTEETRKWIGQKAGVIFNENSSNDKYGYGHIHRDKTNTPSSISKLKKALKLAQSTDISPLKVSASNNITNPDDGAAIASPGRFGKLWQKSRRPWHNFCNPSLGTLANPSNEHIWRTIDKARLAGFIFDDDEALLVVEFRGDGFAPEQVRRIVASAIAMVNGWLPFEDYFFLTTRPDINIETPIAPPGRLYLSSVRFHFIDLLNGSVLFSSEKKKGKTHHSEDDLFRWLKTLQSLILQDRFHHQAYEHEWLRELKNTITPRVSRYLEKVTINDDLDTQTFHENKSTKYNVDDTFSNVIDHLSDAPGVYKNTLSLLKDICINNKWPVTPGSRSSVFRSLKQLGNGHSKKQTQEKHQTRAIFSQFDGHLVQCGCFIVVNPNTFQGKTPMANKLFPDLVDSIFKLEADLKAEGVHDLSSRDTASKHTCSGSTHCVVNRNIEYTSHLKSGNGRPHTLSMIVGLGEYSGGGFIVDGEVYNIRYNTLEFNGWKQIHSSESFQGDRFLLEWYSPEMRQDDDIVDGNNDIRFEDIRADNLINIHTLQLPSYPLLEYRKNSTDSLVINEILDIDKGCCYEINWKSWNNMAKSSGINLKSDFRVQANDCVLDLGAHIGVFARYALSMGCQKIIAFEPEKENYKLLCRNLRPLNTKSCDGEKIKLLNCAVANGNPGVKTFINARNRNDGSLNTWRHCLEEYSQYVDKKASHVSSEGQKATLDRSEVNAVPLFGEFGALKPIITFVKIDCEGAEIDLLLSDESSHSSNWMNVKKLVFEWSFTKERRIKKFHKVVENLESAGFSVVYEGQGSWWDTPESNCRWWPYHTDIIVFAIR